MDERASLDALPASLEPSAMEKDQRGRSDRVSAVTIHIEKVVPAVIAVGNVRQSLDQSWSEWKGPKQDAMPRQASAKTLGDLAVDLGPPTSAQRV